MVFTITPSECDLTHHGIKGQKWGVRRYQNKDGSYTAAGLRRLSGADFDGDKVGSRAVKKPPSQTVIGRVRNAAAFQALMYGGDLMVAYKLATDDSPIKKTGKKFLDEYFAWEEANGLRKRK